LTQQPIACWTLPSARPFLQCPAWLCPRQPLLQLLPLVSPRSHWSSATVTIHQPQSPVISHSHRSSATVTGHQQQSLVSTEQSPLPPSHVVASVSPYTQLQADFPQVVILWKVLRTPSTEVEHHISTTRQPISSKFWRLNSVKLAAAKKEFF
jgi:hypothetical protein